MRKDEEINIYLDKIEELEEIIMRLEALIPEEDVNSLLTSMEKIKNLEN